MVGISAAAQAILALKVVTGIDLWRDAVKDTKTPCYKGEYCRNSLSGFYWYGCSSARVSIRRSNYVKRLEERVVFSNVCCSKRVLNNSTNVRIHDLVIENT